MFVAVNKFCPGKEAALVIIVVSLTCTAYLCGALIEFYGLHFLKPSLVGCWVMKL